MLKSIPIGILHIINWPTQLPLRIQPDFVLINWQVLIEVRFPMPWGTFKAGCECIAGPALVLEQETAGCHGTRIVMLRY